MQIFAVIARSTAEILGGGAIMAPPPRNLSSQNSPGKLGSKIGIGLAASATHPRRNQIWVPPPPPGSEGGVFGSERDEASLATNKDQ